jgi:acyl carrier protein
MIMNNLERYNQIFIEIFNVNSSALNDDFSSETVSSWDSVSQLSLVTSLEDEFDIMFDAEDILDFSSYAVGRKIMTKYGIEL